MPIEQLIVLSIIQGLTEFWPVSSSGHLNLVHLLSKWPDQGALLDVAVHLGSLMAVLIYFWRDVAMLIRAFFDLIRAQFGPETRLLIYLIVASIPLMIVGFILHKTGIYDKMRTVEVIAWANIVFALILWWSDEFPPVKRTMEETGWRDVLYVGVAQIFALIPGASRSGVTMSAARYMGFKRTEAARFAMLLSIPAIFGAGLLASVDLYSGNATMQSDAIFVCVLSFLTALFSIWFMMALLKRMSMLPFVIYRLLLGGFLLSLIYF